MTNKMKSVPKHQHQRRYFLQSICVCNDFGSFCVREWFVVLYWLKRSFVIWLNHGKAHAHRHSNLHISCMFTRNILIAAKCCSMPMNGTHLCFCVLHVLYTMRHKIHNAILSECLLGRERLEETRS